MHQPGGGDLLAVAQVERLQLGEALEVGKPGVGDLVAEIRRVGSSVRVLWRVRLQSLRTVY